MTPTRFTPPPPVTRNWDMLDVVERYESTGFASQEEELDAWQWLVNNGACWQLQGMYGRNAHHLISLGLIKQPFDPSPAREVRFSTEGSERTLRLPYHLPATETVQWLEDHYTEVTQCVYLPYIQQVAEKSYALREMESKDLTHYAPHGVEGGISVNGMICQGRPLVTVTSVVDGVESVLIDGDQFILGEDLKIST